MLVLDGALDLGLGQDAGDARVQQIQCDKRFGPGIVELVFGLARAEERAQRRENAAQA